MSAVQQLLVVLFVGALLVSYRSELLSFAKSLWPCFKDEDKAEEKQSVTLRVVDDIVAVTELRDKLNAEGCAEGVEACTNLLRVIVEHQNPSKGVV